MQKARKKNRKILFQVGVVIILLFSITTFSISNLVVASAFSTCLTGIYGSKTSSAGEVNDLMEMFEVLPWLIDYWTGHSADLRISALLDDYTDTCNDLFEKYDMEAFDEITEAQLSAMQPEEQELFASYCYSMIRTYITASTEGEKPFGIVWAVPDTDTGQAVIVFDESPPVDGFFQFGGTFDLNEFAGYEDNFQFAMVADLRRFAVKLPPADMRFGNRRKMSLNGKELSMQIFYTITADEVYRRMYFTDLIRNDVIIFLILVGLIILIFLYFIVCRPLAFLKKTMIGYGQDKDAQRTAKRLSAIRSRNEIGVFADELSGMALEMQRYTEEVVRLAGEKERISTELNVASQIQMEMLPRAIPDQKAFRVFAEMYPAKEVGGDFYDFFFVDDDHLAIIIADVSDKGIPAALFMAVSKTILRNRAMMGGTPARILMDANNQLCDGNDSSLFVTVWMGILTLSTGELVCANAGHEYPCMRQGNTPFRLLKDIHSPIMGVIEDISCCDETFRLEPGDAVFVYTDGVPEATNADGKMFTTNRLARVLRDLGSEQSPQVILSTVHSAVNAFVDDAPQFDDLTMLCLVYRPKE